MKRTAHHQLDTVCYIQYNVHVVIYWRIHIK